jgi:hypothetical protein
MNGLFQGESGLIFLMAHTERLAPVRGIDCDAIGQRVKDDILQALTRDKQLMASENEC